MSEVLAIVEGREITQEDVNRFLQGLDPQIAMQFQNPQAQGQVIEELINQELIYLDALEEGLDDSDEYKKELEFAKSSILKQLAIRDLLAEAKVEEDELKEFYEENKNMFQRPEMVEASHILVETEEQAKEIIEKLEAGESFEKLAEENSTCPSSQQGGNLGQFGKGQMAPEFEEAAFNLEKDEISGPVKTDFGYHIIKLLDKIESGIEEFETVKHNIQNQLIAKKQQEVYLDKTGKLRDKYNVEMK